MEKVSASCPICLGEPEDPVSLCSCDGAACRDCMKCMVESTVSGAHYGSCPLITCPDPAHTKSNRKVIPIAKWAALVDHRVVARYNTLASQVMAFFCGSCHTQRSLDVGFEDPPGASFAFIEQMLTNSATVSQYDKLKNDIVSFCLNDMTLEDFYTRINFEYFPHLAILTDSEAWELMRPLIKMINEPERRANLHLRYLRDRPRIQTLCCAREHCFKCKIKDFHENMSCFEYSSRLDNTLVNCPSCGIYLTRGDGCNSITCLCGHCFDWNAAKETNQRTQDFLLAYPHNTSTHAAEALCTLPATDSVITLARAWQNRNQPEVNRGLRSIFLRRFAQAVNQYCMLSTDSRLPVPFNNAAITPPGLHEAASLWQLDHTAQIEHCRMQSEVARKSLFTTLFSANKEERVMACHEIILNPTHHDAALVSSARIWRDANHSMYKQHLAKWEQRKAKQFAYLYGNRTLLNFTMTEEVVPFVTSFERGISDADLEFTDENRSTRRPGSASCYPVAFAFPTAEICQFSVVLANLPREGNRITFGLVTTGSMPRSNGSGVGSASNSWGLGEERSTAHSNCSVLAEGRIVVQWRSLKEGDILTSRLNCTEHWMEVALNNNELVHRFTIPSQSSMQFQFAVSFASNAKVTIQSSTKTMSRPLGGSEAIQALPRVPLSKEHSQLFGAFLTQLKSLLDVEGGGNKKQNYKGHALMTDGKAWPMLCGQSFRLTKKIFDAIRPHLLYLVHLRDDHDEHDGGLEELQFLTLNSIIEAVSWFRKNYVEIFEKSDRFYEQQLRASKSNSKTRQRTFKPKPAEKIKNKQGAALVGGMNQQAMEATAASQQQKRRANTTRAAVAAPAPPLPAARAHGRYVPPQNRRSSPPPPAVQQEQGWSSPVSSAPRQRRNRQEQQLQGAVPPPPPPPRVMRQTSR